MSSVLTRHESAVPATPRPLGRVALAAVAALEVYLVASIVFHPADQLEGNFRSEFGSVSLLSSAMLLAAAVLAATTARTMWSGGGLRARLLWSGFAAVLLFFSIDEVMAFHERAGDVLDPVASAGPFRSWNDVVVIAYGLVAVPVALVFLREVRRYPRLLGMLAVSVALYVTTSTIDSLVRTPTPVSIIIEESVKAHCSTFLMLSALTGLAAARWLVATGRAG